MKLAVLTPTRNRLRFLQENVESVRFSNPAPLDLQIVQSVHDCGSEDGTPAWLETLGHSGVKITISDRAMPPGLARNIAAGAITADFFMPLDDDDLMLQRTAHHFVNALSRQHGHTWAVSDFLKIDEEGRHLRGQDYYAWSFGSTGEMLQAIFSGKHFIQGNVCFTRELFERVGGYATDIDTAEDLELYVRFLLDSGLPLYVPMISHLHRIHGTNLSRDIGKDRYNDDLRAIYERHRTSLAKLGIVFEPIP